MPEPSADVHQPDSSLDSARRSALLQASTAVFAHRGFEAPTMDELALACGCTRRTLYRYYPAKEELFWAVAVQAYTRLVMRLRVTAAVWESAGVASAGRIQSWAMAYLDHSLEDPDGFRVIMAGRERAVSTYGVPEALPVCQSINDLALLDREVLGSLGSLGKGLEEEGLVAPGSGEAKLWELLAVLIGLVEFHARYRGGGRQMPFGNAEGIRRIISDQVNQMLTAHQPHIPRYPEEGHIPMKENI